MRAGMHGRDIGDRDINGLFSKKGTGSMTEAQHRRSDPGKTTAESRPRGRAADRAVAAALRTATRGGRIMDQPQRRASMNDEQKTTDSYFGGCPHCGGNDGYTNVGRCHWFFCKAHKTKWLFGSNIFSGWRWETEDEQRCRYNEIGMGEYTEVELPHQHKTRVGLHSMVDDLSQQIYLIDGNGVFDGATIMMLYEQAYGLHDIIDGNPVGTFSAAAAAAMARAARAEDEVVCDYIEF
jgi:hypothetical protein